VLHGYATPEGTRLYAERFPTAGNNYFYRVAHELHVSSLGLGTYLGEADDATDRKYEHAATVALRSGINFLDTAINYREQRSERALGSALRVLLNANELQRDQFVISTKAGFLTPGAIPEWLDDDDVAGAMHSMHPEFLEDQINRSRVNLGLDTIDVFYIHNPETQLRFVPREIFEHRLQLAFERLERLASERRIRWYGTATWDGYREPGQLDLERVIDLVRYVGGEEHRFRFIQLPFNLGMIEAYMQRDEQGVSILKMADRAGIAVVASATLHQGRLARDLPKIVTSRIPGLKSNAAQAIQFTRSTPGIAVALTGMSGVEHVRENLEIAGVPPMGLPEYEKLYRPVEA
jgi:aryl-alcohol dehydrogenase-like predicted oxidoreductase